MRMSVSLRAAGHLLALSPMVLLVAGVIFGAPWFVFAFFFGVLPMVRMLLPDDLAEPAEIGRISRMQFIFLKSIPLAHALMWALVLPWAMFVVSQLQPAQLACFALSFWVVTSLNLTIAHELLHRPVGWQRIAARLLAGSIGYFQMLEEHRSHHVNVGGRDNGDSPEVGESIFTYARKRYVRSFQRAQEWERLDQVRRGRARWNNRIAWTALMTIAVMVCFGLVAGWRGVVFYGFVIAGTAFTMQAITYIQHWGLTDRLSPGLGAVGYSWEDRCVMQAWVTLNHAYHGHHHVHPSLPYFRLGGFANSPRLPASYPVMLLMAMIPPLFRRTMGRRLDAWLAAEGSQQPQPRQPCANLGEFFRS